MPEWQFQQWQHYAARKMLPSRRLELYLAQIACVLAQVNGSKNAQLTDFLFDPPEVVEVVAGPADPVAAQKFFGFAPRPKKRSE